MEEIKFSDMVSDLAKPGADIIATLTPERMHAVHMVIGIIGEVQEFSQALHENSDDDHLIEELGDIEFYFEGLLQGYGLTAEPNVLGEPVEPGNIRSLLNASGELLDLVKKEAIYNKAANVEGIAKACADLRMQLDLAYQGLELERNTVIEANIYKLARGPKARYKGGKYSDSAAQTRADKA